MHYARWSKHGDPLITTPRATRSTCSVEGCDRHGIARTYCTLHYARWQKHGDPLFVRPAREVNECSVDGCLAPSIARGWCQRHWSFWRRSGVPAPQRMTGLPCKADGCQRPASSGGWGWCNTHYRRLKRYGDVRQDVPVGSVAAFNLKSHCAQGHALTGRNVGRSGRKRRVRYCRPCSADASGRRRAWRVNAEVNDLTAAQWTAIKAAYKQRCAYCHRRSRSLTKDHVVPLSHGGNHTASNIVPACQSCNSSKSNRPAPTYQPLLF